MCRVPAQSTTPVPCTWSSEAVSWLDQLTLQFPGQPVSNTVINVKLIYKTLGGNALDVNMQD